MSTDPDVSKAGPRYTDLYVYADLPSCPLMSLHPDVDAEYNRCQLYILSRYFSQD